MKITFEEALVITDRVIRVNHIALQSLDQKLTPEEGRSLLFFAQRGITSSSIKEIIDDLVARYKIPDRQKMEVKFSKFCGSLVEKGYLHKRKDSTDRRILIVELTEQGLSFVQEFKTIAQEIWESTEEND